MAAGFLAAGAAFAGAFAGAFAAAFAGALTAAFAGAFAAALAGAFVAIGFFGYSVRILRRDASCPVIGTRSEIVLVRETSLPGARPGPGL